MDKLLFKDFRVYVQIMAGNGMDFDQLEPTQILHIFDNITIFWLRSLVLQTKITPSSNIRLQILFLSLRMVCFVIV